MTKIQTIYGITLQVTYGRIDRDAFDPVSGHYTVKGPRRVDQIIHNGEDICDIVSDEVVYRLERQANAEN